MEQFPGQSVSRAESLENNDSTSLENQEGLGKYHSSMKGLVDLMQKYPEEFYSKEDVVNFTSSSNTMLKKSFNEVVEGLQKLEAKTDKDNVNDILMNTLRETRSLTNSFKKRSFFEKKLDPAVRESISEVINNLKDLREDFFGFTSSEETFSPQYEAAQLIYNLEQFSK